MSVIQGLSRRAFLAAAVVPPDLSSRPALDPADWASFKDRFIQPAGRVIDTGNHGVSHTEGQGWGLLFAVAFDDRAAFDAILGWTTRTLRRPNDALHIWRFDPNRKNPLEDRNNATDGDIFIATALLRAARRWNEPDYARTARKIAADIERLLVREQGGRAVLLPGVSGFDTPGRLAAALLL